MSSLPSHDLEVEFDDKFDLNEYKCIEIDESMLDELASGKLEIRGSNTEEAALVTSSKTYKIRQADFSNSQFLLLPENSNQDELSFGSTRVITGAISCHYILAPQPPGVASLYELLLKQPYKGEDSENTDERPMFLDDDEYDFDTMDHDDNKSNEKVDLSFENLQTMIQASDKEILDALHDMNAIEINGQWRVLDSEYLTECFEDCINSITSSNMRYNSIDVDVLHQSILEDDQIEGQYSKQILEHCIKMHSFPKNADADGQKYSLNLDKLCWFVGKRILEDNQARMNKQEFLITWQNTVPVDLRGHCKLDLLTGHALILKDARNAANGAVVELFEEQELSPEPKHRFEQLFKKKSEWTMEEIQPYLKSLEKGGVKVDKILLKNTRTVRKRDRENREYRVFASRNARA